MPLETAEKDYLAWTNVVLTNARTRAKRKGHFWAYVQITERQQRGHPHSHIITSYLPDDAVEVVSEENRSNFHSSWFDAANKSAGLGSQHRISKVNDASAVSRYVAKYMFKDSMLTRWPAHWRRVRYSQNWPTPPYVKAEFVVSLFKPQDWRRADNQDVVYVCDNDGIFDLAKHHIQNICKRMDNLTF